VAGVPSLARPGTEARPAGRPPPRWRWPLAGITCS